MLTGAILAGGAGKRMGGDKPARVLLGKTLLAHAGKLVAPLCDEVLIVGPGGLPDALPDAGPLGGLLAALEAARHERVLVVTVDMPAVPPAALGALAGTEAGAVNFGEPFPGVYARSVAPGLRAYLESGQRRAREFTRSLEPLVIEPEPAWIPGLECNVNTPDDLRRAAQLIRSNPA